MLATAPIVRRSRRPAEHRPLVVFSNTPDTGRAQGVAWWDGLGELSVEIADTDNPRFRRELVHRRGVLFRIHGALAPEADAV